MSSKSIAAAQTAASGPLNEVDLESYEGSLVFNVDVGSHDVKVDASTGKVLAAPSTSRDGPRPDGSDRRALSAPPVLRPGPRRRRPLTAGATGAHDAPGGG